MKQYLFIGDIELTKQPSYVTMNISIHTDSRYANDLPMGFRLNYNEFLTGTTVEIECTTDGSLPPLPILFKIECPPPPIALIEYDRVTQANRHVSYEMYYKSFGFYSPPTLDDLGPFLAKKRANSILEQGHVSTEDRNRTRRAKLTLNENAHQCHVICQLMGKEKRAQLTVYYPTTVAYILPHPRDGMVEVGSEMTCYADGFPLPQISLSFYQPLRSPAPLTQAEIDDLREQGVLSREDEDSITIAHRLHERKLPFQPYQITDPKNGGNGQQPPRSSASALSPYYGGGSDSDRWSSYNVRHQSPNGPIPGSGLFVRSDSELLGMSPDEYEISGPRFLIRRNATPGVELMLDCDARNLLPGQPTFLGMNGTRARIRFTVVAGKSTPGTSLSSIGVAFGVCAGALAIILLVICIFALTRSRKNQRADAASGGRGASNRSGRKKMYKSPAQAATAAYSNTGPNDCQPLTRPPHTRFHQPHKPLYTGPPPPTAAVAAYSDPAPPVHDPYTVDPQQQQPRHHFNSNYDTVCSNDSIRNALPPHQADEPRPRPIPSSHSLSISGDHPSFNGHHQQATAAASLPHGLNISSSRQPPGDPQDEHYTEIIGYIQPKPGHNSQQLLEQQQQATQALLSMRQTHPRVFV